MKAGDLVRHRNIPEEALRVKSITETIVLVERINEPQIWYGGRQVMDYPVYICDISNLEVIDRKQEQLPLF